MTRKKSRPTHRESAAAVPSNEGGFYKMFWNSMDVPGTTRPNSPSQSVNSPVIVIDDSPIGSPIEVDDNSCDSLTIPRPIKEETEENCPETAETSPRNVQDSEIKVNGDSHQSCLPDPPQETPRTKEVGGSALFAQDIQVRDQITTEKHDNISESNCTAVTNAITEEMSSFADVNLYSPSCVNTRDTPVPNACFPLAPPGGEKMLVETPTMHQEIPVDAVFSEELPTNNSNEGIPEETPMDVVLHHDTPLDEPPTDDIIPDNQFSTISDITNEENIDSLSKEGLDLEGSLSLLQRLLNAPDDEINDAVNRLPGLTELIGSQHCVEPEGQDVEQMSELESAQISDFHSSVNVPSLDSSMSENIHPADGNLTADNSHPILTNDVDVEEEEEFPTFNSNFLPKKIKLDSIGVIRSVKFLKEQVRTLYKEYLNDDVLLRTVSEPQPPVEEKSPANDVEETAFPPVSIPYPMCFVKVERLPDPFVKKSTVAMSDDTFRTWKREIIRQRNEEKFRHLKVWRRGRTLLWRECELAGMDRTTYDEQVAYVKKHKLKENSSSDSESSSGDESGHDASFLHNDSSEDSSSEEDGVSCEDDEVSSVDLPSSPMKLDNSGTRSVTPPHTETPSTTLPPRNEYVVENSSANQSSANVAPTPLKITIRKASFSKSEEEKEKMDREENFTVPSHPTVQKPRKVATKRTFRRPSDPIHKANVPPKSTEADSKKSKTIPVAVEDLYDQSLLGRRSYEVENFNLLEKWDIPFEEPTLFRSPRAASRLAQLRTKEAFAPALKRHGPPKTSTTTNSITVSKEVKDVVEMLCSKTVEAMLFPVSKLKSPKKCTKTDEDNSAKSPARRSKPNELLTPSELSEDATSNLDDSADVSHSETSSILGTSSDFGGSTTSLLSEDLAPPKNTSPPKARRRRRTGTAWGKKKKVKGKANTEVRVMRESNEQDDHPAEQSLNLPVLVPPCTQPMKKIVFENINSVQGDIASPAHSTQVPVVSEGPGQSPRESEEDSAVRTKRHAIENKSNHTVTNSNEQNKPSDVKMSKPLAEDRQLYEKEQQEIVSPRLTRSKQPIVDLDPDLLENIGTRKRKPKTDILHDCSQDGDKKPKQVDSKNTPQRSTVQSIKPSAIVSEDASSNIGEVMDDDSNTQVPEVSEGPGEASTLDTEDKQHQVNKADAEKPPVRVLRSRSRVHPPTQKTNACAQDNSSADQKTGKPGEVEEKTDGKNQPQDLDVLESPLSPPPEPDPLINTRITRSKNKRRSRPAYVFVKSTDESALPSVCDIVDSIAEQRLPLSKLFDNSSSSVEPGPVQSYGELTSSDDSADIGGKEKSSSSSEVDPELSAAQSQSDVGELVESAREGLNVELNQATGTSDVGSGNEPKEMSVTSFGLAAQTSDQSNKSTVEPSADVQVQEKEPAAAVDPHAAADGSSEAANANSQLGHEKILPQKEESDTKSGTLEVLNIVNSMKQSLTASPTKSRAPEGIVNPPLSGGHLETVHLDITSPQPSVSNLISSVATVSTSLATFPSSTQDICSILPGTFLNSLFNSSSLDASLTTYSNEANDPSLTDDPGDLVIDESANDLDVNFFDNLTNADLSKADDNDFSDDENNTDLTDKINKIVREQICQDPVPVPCLKPKETGANSNDGKKPQEEISFDKSASLNRRDSIDERTGLPNNLIQRLRDPRIRSRLLSHLEEVETNDKAPQSSIAALLNIVPTSDVTSSTVEGPQAVKISDPRKKIDGAVSYPSVSSTVDSCQSSHVSAASPATTLPVVAGPLETTGRAAIASQPLAVSIAPALTTPFLQPGAPGGQPLTQGTPIRHVDKPEEPPDPSKVEFLVPPSDDEDEEESIKRRPKKAKKEVDVELMYKSPLEDLQSEARPAYGERAPRRYGENFPRRRSDDRRPRWDDRRSRHDDRDSRPSRDRSRGRYEDRGRDHSRDRRSYYDRPPRDQSRDRRYDPYPGSPHQVYPPSSPWSVGEPAFNHQTMIQHPETRQWQQNYYVPQHPPLFGPEPPKIDYMETRLINLEILPKTTNLHVPAIKKVYDNFNKDNVQVLKTPPPTFDPKDEPEPLRMLDPVTEEMVEVLPTPRPTSGLKKAFFSRVPPDLTLDDVVKFHFITPAYVMVQDNEEDQEESSSDEDAGLSGKNNDKLKLSGRKEEKPAVEHKKRSSKPSRDHHQKGESKISLPNELYDPERVRLVPEVRVKPKRNSEAPLKNDALQEILSNLPLLREQYSLEKSHPVEPIPPPPPAPVWNDVDLRVSLPEREGLLERNPSPPRKNSKNRSRSRSRSPYPNKSPRRRRSRSRSPSLRSDMSISPPSSRSRSPSYSRREHESSRRRRSRSRSSERSRSRRSSPRRHSTSISPSRRYSRR